MKKNIELRGGFLWYQSFTKSDRDNHLFQIQTANAKVQYDKGEAILSFDPFSGKSQLLVIKGYNLFSNRHKIGQGLEVKSGYFSFIQNDHENGNPRLPTPISSTSYQKVTSLFNDIEPPNFLTVERFKVQTPKKRKKSFTGERKLASVSAPVPVAITVEKTNPIPSGKNMFENTAIKVRPTTHKAHRIQTQTCPCPCPDQRRTDRQTSSKKQHSSVEVHIYRPSQQNHSSIKTPKTLKAPTAVKKKPKKQIYARPKIIFRKTASLPKRKKQVNRGPASIPPLQITPEAESNPFEAALKKEYQKQARHDREVNELIDALKSVDMDYKKNY